MALSWLIMTWLVQNITESGNQQRGRRRTVARRQWRVKFSMPCGRSHPALRSKPPLNAGFSISLPSVGDELPYPLG
jgi:hypothetical protein